MTISDYAENKLLDAVFNATAFSVTSVFVVELLQAHDDRLPLSLGVPHRGPNG